MKWSVMVESLQKSFAPRVEIETTTFNYLTFFITIRRVTDYVQMIVWPKSSVLCLYESHTRITHANTVDFK